MGRTWLWNGTAWQALPMGLGWSDIKGKPTSFSPSAHAASHATGGADAISPASIGAAAASHTHAISDTTGLQTALDGKQAAGSYAPATGISPSAITGTAVIDTDARLSDSRTPTAHNQAASTITGLASVATTGAYADLSGTPTAFNPAAPGAIGGTTAAPGSFTTLLTSGNGAASAPPARLTGTWFSGGTATTTKPQFLIEPAGTTSTSWSTAGTGLGVNAASGFAGNLADFQVNGTYQARILSTGALRWNTTNNPEWFPIAGGILWRLFNGGAAMFGFYNNFLLLNVSMELSWNSIGDAGNPAGRDLTLLRDAADTLAQRRGTNPQTFRLYNTYTDASNYERGVMRWSGNALQIGTEKLGTGTARGLELRTDNVARISLSATGGIGFYGAVASAQPTAVADATDAASVITQINALLSRLRTIGIIAT